MVRMIRVWRDHAFDVKDETMAHMIAKGINAAPNTTGVKNAKAEKWEETGKWGITFDVPDNSDT
jgi:hypothetical protein